MTTQTLYTMTADLPVTTPRLDDGDIRVLLLENIHADGAEFLRAQGYQVETRTGALDEAELIEALQGVHLLGHPLQDPRHGRVLAHAPDLLAIGAFCIGTNQIDLASAAARGVAVFNAPFSNTRSVVELAIAEIISLTRRLTEKTNAHARRASGTSPPSGATRSAAARSASSATATSAASCPCSPRRSGM